MRIIFFIIVIFSLNRATAQSLQGRYSLGVTPMHKFFQRYTDSTLMIEYANVPDGKPSTYRILSKTDSFTNVFEYKPVDTSYYNLYRFKKNLPALLWNTIGIERSSFKNRAADINIFFHLVSLRPDTTKKMWEAISAFKPWQLADDEAYPPCPPGKVYAAVVDGPHYILHLITKSGIKTLVYYYPSYYEKEACPGNINRQALLKIYALFEKYYNKKTN